MDRFCLDCKQVIFGRRDKKFCNDACRSNYNNRKNSQLNTFIRQVDHTLKKNRNILLQLNPSGKTKVLRERMNKMGFDFGYFTNILETAKGDRYLFCYEQGYLPINDHEVLLVKKKEQ